MKWQPRLRVLALLLALAIPFVGVGAAYADAIVQSFSSSDTIPPGWMVSLNKNSSNTVSLTPANQSDQVYGVSIDPSQAPVTLQRQSGQRVFVATSGVYPLLVSTENGSVQPGDYLSISSTSGIADKANTSQLLIIGQATQKFDGSSGVLSSGNGFQVGKINVTIMSERNPLLKNDIAVPSIVRKVGDNIAGKEVSSVRVYVGLAIFLAATIMAFAILWAGIRSSVISIGRNPLSRKSILKALAEVIIAALLVLALGLTGVYLLLRL